MKARRQLRKEFKFDAGADYASMPMVGFRAPIPAISHICGMAWSQEVGLSSNIDRLLILIPASWLPFEA